MAKSSCKPSRIALVVALATGLGANAAHADETTRPSAIEEALEALVKGFYGTFDVSIDESTKGMNGMRAYQIMQLPNGSYGLDYAAPKGFDTTPFGRVGWQPAISTNASGLGWRGSHSLPNTETKFLLQIEAQVGLTASPGTLTGYTAQTNGTSGTIGLGNSFVGFGNPYWGAVKVGHGITPYKKATDRLDPFAGMVGDMPVIMGNTGGDNRVEFNSVMDHAIWYESPRWSGFSFDALYSPGQNRTADSNLNLAGGSSNCNGGNIPGSGNLPDNCDDGGFDDAFSLAFKYETKHLYLTAAWELHRNVNRNSDGIGSNSPIYGATVNGNATVNPTPLAAYIDPYYLVGGGLQTGDPSLFTDFWDNGGSAPFINDIGNEQARKVGVQYLFDSGLTVDAIFERMTRTLPAVLEFQNERQRNGWWLAATQELSDIDNVSLGWAHAGKTPGDPAGQHNFDPANTNDSADMFTLAWKHKLDSQLYWYANIAETLNHGNAHFDLGGGGHGIKTDCHDGTTSPIADYSSAGPTTWGGCHPKAVSVGVNYKF